nr:universal stress protein [Salinadaptatus halalkaliphilus]
MAHHPTHDVTTEYAAEEDVDLLVMGPESKSNLERLVVGSVSQRVVPDAPVPVLTARTVETESPACSPRRPCRSIYPGVNTGIEPMYYSQKLGLEKLSDTFDGTNHGDRSADWYSRRDTSLHT